MLSFHWATFSIISEHMERDFMICFCLKCVLHAAVMRASERKTKAHTLTKYSNENWWNGKWIMMAMEHFEPINPSVNLIKMLCVSVSSMLMKELPALCFHFQIYSKPFNSKTINFSPHSFHLPHKYICLQS